LRILHVARQYLPSVGGIQATVAALAERQVLRGHVVTVATLARSQFTGERFGLAREVLNGVEVLRLPHVGPRQYSVALGLARYLRGRSLVHVHSMDFFCDYLALLEWWHRVPMVLTTHGLYFHSSDVLGFKRLYLQTVTRLSLRAYREVVAVSAEDYTRLKGVRDRVHIIPNGVDIDLFGSIRRQPERALLVAIGTSLPHKRVDLLTETYRQLTRLVPEARLVLVGSERVFEFAGIEATGMLPPEKLLELLTRATLVCSASDYEGFGLAILEAMAAGVPCAVRPSHPMARLGPDAGVFTVDFPTPKSAASQLAEVLGDDQLLAQAGASARSHARKYGWESVEAMYEDIYACAER
jgi:alpha-1,3-mannosyltransferase